MRKFFAILLFVPILLLFFVVTFAQVVQSSFLEAASYKQLFSRTDLYGKAEDLMVQALEKNGAQVFTQIPILKSEDVSEVLRATFPAVFLKETVERIFDQFFAWIKSSDPSLHVFVSLQRPREVFPAVFERVVSDRFQSTPVCAGDDLDQMRKFITRPEGSEEQITIPSCRLSSWKTWEDAVEVLVPGAPINSTFIKDIMRVIPDEADLIAILYRLEHQNQNGQDAVAEKPIISADGASVLVPFFQPIPEGETPLFLKGFNDARTIVQKITKDLTYLWIFFAAMLLLFFLLVSTSLSSFLHWTGSLFVFLGGVLLTTTLLLHDLILNTVIVNLFEDQEQLSDISGIATSLLQDVADALFSSLQIIAAVVFIFGLLIFLASVFIHKDKQSGKLKFSSRMNGR